VIRRALRLLAAPEWRWLLVVALWSTVLALGYAGLSASPGGPTSTLDRVYATVQLFLAQYPNGIRSTHWALEVARFAAPILAASTVVAAFAALFRERVGRFWLRFARGHVVVAGLGEKGYRLAAGFCERGSRVVAIERDDDAPNLAPARERGIAVLMGDATDPLLLARARVHTAADVIAVCGDEGTNAEIAAVVRVAVRDNAGSTVRCSVHLLDAALCGLLRHQTLREATAGLRLEFFNVYQHGARLLLAAAGPLASGGAGLPHVIVFGLGQLGQSLTLAAVQRRAEDTSSTDRVRMTVVDRDATARVEAMRLRHPSLDRFADVRPVDIDLELPAPGSAETLRKILTDDAPATVYICFDDDSLGISTGLWARRTLASSRGPVIVRTRSEAGLAVILEGEDDGALPGLSAFALLDRTCTPDLITGGVHEMVARALHDEYLSGLDSTRGATAGEYARPWDELPNEMQESNRRAADQISAGLRAIGCDLAPLDVWDGKDFELAPDELDALARIEHERWMGERISAGWRYGTERDDERKLNPLLRPWEELPPDARAGGLQTARELPALLARAGFEIVRAPALSRLPGAG
jgi:hypothetical protein